MKTQYDKLADEALRSLSEDQLEMLVNAFSAREKNIKPVPFPTNQKDITLKKVMPIVINEILEGRDITCDYKINGERFYGKLNPYKFQRESTK